MSQGQLLSGWNKLTPDELLKSLLEKNELTREKLFELGRYNPVILNALRLWDRKAITYEEAMYVIIFQLTQSNIKLMKQVMELNNCVTPTIISRLKLTENLTEEQLINLANSYLGR